MQDPTSIDVEALARKIAASPKGKAALAKIMAPVTSGSASSLTVSAGGKSVTLTADDAPKG